jgi:hypothetical protein
MNRLTITWTIGLGLLIATGAAGQTRARPVAEAKRPLPHWSEVEQIVKHSLASRYGYKPGDIIAKSDVQKGLAKLDAHGWKVADAEKVLKATPADDEFIVQRLRAPEGWNFMRHVATYPEGYDRVDRLLHMPRGPAMVADLITNPTGYQLFQYMTTDPGGVEMGRMLERIPDGKGFNNSTHRLYTEERLLARLHKSYDAETKRREEEGRG